MNIPWQVQLMQFMSSEVVRDGCRLLVNSEIIDGKIRLVFKLMYNFGYKSGINLDFGLGIEITPPIGQQKFKWFKNFQRVTFIGDVRGTHQYRLDQTLWLLEGPQKEQIRKLSHIIWPKPYSPFNLLHII